VTSAQPPAGFRHITRSLVPSLLGRMNGPPTGFALELSPDRLVDWAVERSRLPRPILCQP